MEDHPVRKDPTFCLSPRFLEGLKLLPEFGFSFDICISHHQLAPAVEMAARCPAVSFVLGHVAKPDIKAGSCETWATHIGRLADLSNVTCNISGMVTEADHAGWREKQPAPYIDRVIGCFGIERFMFGGDWPVVPLASTWAGWFNVLARAARSLRPEEQDFSCTKTYNGSTASHRDPTSRRGAQ